MTEQEYIGLVQMGMLRYQRRPDRPIVRVRTCCACAHYPSIGVGKDERRTVPTICGECGAEKSSWVFCSAHVEANVCIAPATTD